MLTQSTVMRNLNSVMAFRFHLLGKNFVTCLFCHCMLVSYCFFLDLEAHLPSLLLLCILCIVKFFFFFFELKVIYVCLEKVTRC